MAGLYLHSGDITRMEVDVLVNAANKTLLGGGGVDGAIHAAAGFKLKEYCRKLKGCETGEAKISPGFDLAAKWVVHTVGPVYGRHGGAEAQLLQACYANSLSLAAEQGARSIAFPSISTGAYNYPPEEAAEVALTASEQFLSGDTSLESIYFVCFDRRNFDVYRKKFEARQLPDAKAVFWRDLPPKTK